MNATVIFPTGQRQPTHVSILGEQFVNTSFGTFQKEVGEWLYICDPAIKLEIEQPTRKPGEITAAQVDFAGVPYTTLLSFAHYTQGMARGGDQAAVRVIESFASCFPDELRSLGAIKEVDPATPTIESKPEEDHPITSIRPMTPMSPRLKTISRFIDDHRQRLTVGGQLCAVKLMREGDKLAGQHLPEPAVAFFLDNGQLHATRDLDTFEREFMAGHEDPHRADQEPHPSATSGQEPSTLFGGQSVSPPRE